MMFHNSNQKRESVQGKDIVEDNLAQGILIGKSLILVRKKKPSDQTGYLLLLIPQVRKKKSHRGLVSETSSSMVLFSLP